MATKRGRPHKHRYLPYEDAKEYVQKKSNARSRKQYWRWHDSVKPPIPKYPHRTYAEWESWNEFLNTTNSFEKNLAKKHNKKLKVYRPFWEAVRAAQHYAKQYGIDTQDKWLEWHDSGMCPDDIPKYPYHVYEEWKGTGWTTWLGKSLKGKIETAKQEVGVMALCTTPGMPGNVLTVVVDNNGLSSLKEKWDDSVMGKPLRVYKWEKELIPYVDRIFRQFAFDKGDRKWLCPNVHALIFELDSILEFAIKPNR